MKSQDRILTTHVGSLIRPPALVELLVKESQGERVDPKAVRACIDSEVPKIVRRQVDAGIDIVNDGEFGKALSWTHYIAARLTGVEVRHDVMPEFTKAGPGKDRTDFAEFYAEYEEQYGPAGMGKETFGSLMRMPTAVTGPLGYRPEEVRADIARLKAAMKSSGVERGFLPVAAPVSAAATLGNAYYKSSEELMFGVAEALAVEYKEIVDSGLTVQIDDGFLAPSYDGMVPPMSLNDYRSWVNVGVEALNHALKGIPEDRVRYHVCWGSWNGPHSNDVNVRDILDLILKVKAGGYSLEMANPRHEHEWRVWEKTRLPAGKVLYPGVVTHSTNVVEHPELVAERIVRLANLVGRESVVASTDCGFAQGPFARRVHPSIQWAKLTSLAEGARIATQELWGRKAA